MQPAQQHFLEKLRLEWAEESVNDEERRHKGKEENDQAQELSVVPPSKTPLVLVCPDGKVCRSSSLWLHFLYSALQVCLRQLTSKTQNQDSVSCECTEALPVTPCLPSSFSARPTY